MRISRYNDFNENVNSQHNKYIKYISENYPLIKTYDIIKRRDGEWGIEVVENDLKSGDETVVWNGGDTINLKISNFMEMPYIKNNNIKPPFNLNKYGISIFNGENSVNIKERTMFILASYPSEYKFGEVSKWNVHEVYSETLPISNWMNPLNKERVRNKKERIDKFNKMLSEL